jgi:hypothetical protein
MKTTGPKSYLWSNICSLMGEPDPAGHQTLLATLRGGFFAPKNDFILGGSEPGKCNSPKNAPYSVDRIEPHSVH